MPVFYALEDGSPWFVLAFAGACGLALIYGFLQGPLRLSSPIRFSKKTFLLVHRYFPSFAKPF